MSVSWVVLSVLSLLNCRPMLLPTPFSRLTLPHHSNPLPYSPTPLCHICHSTLHSCSHSHSIFLLFHSSFISLCITFVSVFPILCFYLWICLWISTRIWIFHPIIGILSLHHSNSILLLLYIRNHSHLYSSFTLICLAFLCTVYSFLIAVRLINTIFFNLSRCSNCCYYLY